MRIFSIIPTAAIILIWSCNSSDQKVIINANAQEINSRSGNSIDDDFKSYWYSGKAEVTSYTLEQARYGELRTGEAVLIFVTEDFSKAKEVKLDDPSSAKEDALSILKLNLVKKFNTGIYPYSLMSSVFSPVNGGHALKETASAQEWCGQTFTQLNLEGDQYHFQLHSYFESEGEIDTTLNIAWLEDELWTQIRLDPKNLPIGEIRVLPGLLSQRLRHSESKPVSATATVRDADSSELKRFQENGNLSVFTLNYPLEKRTLSIYFEERFPYRIAGWEETYMDGFADKKKMLTTRAIRIKTMNTDYWKHNSEADTSLRDSLGLFRYH